MTNKTFAELRAKISALEEELSELKRKIEDFYIPLTESTNESLNIVDKECTYLFVTDNMAVNFNTPLHEVIGKKYGDFHTPDAARVFEERVAEVFATGRTTADEHIASFNDKCIYRTFHPIKTTQGDVVRVAVIGQDITERKQMETALQESEKAARRLAQENDLIAEIGRIISSTLNINEVYERFAEKVREIIPFDRIAVNTINIKDYTRTIRYVKDNSFSSDRLGKVYSLAGTGIEQALRTKSSLLINGKNKEDAIRKFPGISSLQLGAQATMIIPLISKDEVIGSLVIHSVRIDAYSKNDLLLAERIGAQIAGAVANAQLFLERQQAEEALQSGEEEARRLAKENEVIAEIGRIISSSMNIDEVYERFAEEVHKLISIDRITINVVNPRDNTVTNAYISGTELPHRKKGAIYPLAFTMTEEVMRTRTSLLINEENYQDYVDRFPGFALSFQAGFRSLMVVPLISKDEVIGVLQFRSTKLSTYSEKDMELAERVGYQIAGAIANAQLFLERRQAEEALKESEAKYYDLYENAPDMYYSIDLATGTIRECNETFVQTTGYAREELIGRPIFELYDEGSVDDAKTAFHQFAATGEVRDAARRVKCKDGRIIDVSLNVSAIRDKGGNIRYSRSIWHDITERKKYEEIIRNLSISDQMTGLYNRRGFITLAEQQLRVAERTRKGMLLIYADLDGLKRINDNLGHKAGDEALVEAAHVLKEAFRKMDIIARVGGDEFAILAPEVSTEYSGMVEERLRHQLDCCNTRTGRNFNISISVGMAYHDPENPCSLDELISRADSLMYEQKKNKGKE